jgi:hypothetical protein
MARPPNSGPYGEQTTPVRVPVSRLERFYEWLRTDIAEHPAKPFSGAENGKKR